MYYRSNASSTLGIKLEQVDGAVSALNTYADANNLVKFKASGDKIVFK